MRLTVEEWSGRVSTAFWRVDDSSFGNVRRGALRVFIAAFIWFKGGGGSNEAIGE